MLVSGSKIHTLKAIATPALQQDPRQKKKPFAVPQGQPVRISVVNPDDYFQAMPGQPGGTGTEYVPHAGFSQSKLILGRAGQTASSIQTLTAKQRPHRNQGAGEHSANTTLTQLIQQPTGGHSRTQSQPGSGAGLTAQASSGQLGEGRVDETGREASPFKGAAGETLIARSDYENTLSKILAGTKDRHGKQNPGLKEASPARASKERSKKPRVRDEELIENYYRYSLQVGEALTQDAAGQRAPESQYRISPLTKETS